MSMKAMNDIREMLCDELDDISRKGDLNVRDLDVIYKVTQSIASLDDIMEEDGYSHDGGWEAKMRGSYGNDIIMKQTIGEIPYDDQLCMGA